MRLICPNCGAQYDISNDAIPPGGRDVQCSSCAHTWFQTEKPVVPGRIPANKQASAAPEEPAPESQAPAPQHPPAPERKPLDTSVSSILRQELRHERTARATDKSGPPATEEAAPPPRVDAEETRRRISTLTRIEGGIPSTAAATVAAASTGAVTDDTHIRSVPSIDEINASLRARAEATDPSGLTQTEQEDVKKRRGFRRGFVFALVLLAILVAPYIFQEQINENLPQLRDYMATYVETVDQLRITLNDQVQKARAMIEGFTAGDDVT